MKLLKRIPILVLIAVLLLLGCIACDSGDEPDETTEAPVTTTARPVYALELSADKTVAGRGETVNLSAILKAEGAPDIPSEGTVFTITEGGDYATLSGAVLTVAANAPDGVAVRVQAREGATASNVVVINISVPVEELEISANGVTNVMPGNSVSLTKTVTPNGAASAITWSIVEGSNIATMNGDVLVVNATAPTGATIKVKAVAGDVESNVLSFTVGYPLESLVAQVIGSSNIEGGNTAQIAVIKTPANATNGDYTIVIVEGAEYATVIGNIISVNTTAPTGATIKVKAVAGDVESAPITITVGTPIETITISSNAPAILDRGGNYPISLSATPDGASLKGIHWVITEGADYASVVNSTLCINANTPAGTTVKLKATSGSVQSNELTFQVGVALEKLEIALNGSANIDPDTSRGITATLTPANATDSTITWVITAGNEYATVAGGVITIAEDAPIGAAVSFYAEIGDIKSNTIDVVVGKPITAIQLSAIGSTTVVKGNTVSILATLEPAGASASSLTWVITEGADYATITASTLVVKSDAPTGATIKVKATAGDVESNELSFTVAPTQEEIDASRLFLDLSSDSFTLDKKGSSAPSLSVEIRNGSNQLVTDKNVVFTVIEGGQYLQVTADGNRCYFTAHGHGTATVEVRIEGTDVATTADVNVIVPPDAIDLPEVFKERPLSTLHEGAYSFSLVDALPFVPSVRGGNLVCQDYRITFQDGNGATGDAVATYENGQITFKKTGKITLTISSTSGSKIEATTSYAFNINEGYNVHTFAELDRVVESDSYNGQVINIVVLEKPDGSANNKTYGYDLVPPTALLAKEDQTYAELRRGGQNRCQAVNKSLYINGNGHKIDASQMRLYTLEEFNQYVEDTGYSEMSAAGSLLSAEPYANDGYEAYNQNPGTYRVNIYDLELIGNCPIDYAGAVGTDMPGAYTVGLAIGNSAPYKSQYYVDADDITVSAFNHGMNITGVVGNGTLKNVYAYNCYQNGLSVRSSIITIENVKLGPCGATGIELTPERCGEAGVNRNENSHLTLAGTIDASQNLNDGNSVYFTKYQPMPNVTVPLIINGNVAMYDPAQISHIRNSNSQFVFVALIFNDLSTLAANTSEITYPSYMAGGIVNIGDLPTDGMDTTHEYVRMPIYADIPGVGNTCIGSALFLNQNYGK